MGVDSGLPDFRGARGFWTAYPPLQKLGIDFYEAANAAWFDRRPRLAWGFYGHRLGLYRTTTPHAGFDILRGWAEAMPLGARVFTSNVDGQFQKAGFDPDTIVECHGSIHHAQCSSPCHQAIWTAEDLNIVVEMETLLAEEPIPECPRCGGIARPNILMFGDGAWIADRTGEQDVAFRAWLRSIRGCKLVVVECGAGNSVPTVRRQSEILQSVDKATLIRINPQDPEGPPGTISIALGAVEGLRGIQMV